MNSLPLPPPPPPPASKNNAATDGGAGGGVSSPRVKPRGMPPPPPQPHYLQQPSQQQHPSSRASPPVAAQPPPAPPPPPASSAPPPPPPPPEPSHSAPPPPPPPPPSTSGGQVTPRDRKASIASSAARGRRTSRRLSRRRSSRRRSSALSAFSDSSTSLLHELAASRSKLKQIGSSTESLMSQKKRRGTNTSLESVVRNRLMNIRSAVDSDSEEESWYGSTDSDGDWATDPAPATSATRASDSSSASATPQSTGRVEPAKASAVAANTESSIIAKTEESLRGSVVEEGRQGWASPRTERLRARQSEAMSAQATESPRVVEEGRQGWQSPRTLMRQRRERADSNRQSLPRGESNVASLLAKFGERTKATNIPKKPQPTAKPEPEPPVQSSVRAATTYAQQLQASEAQSPDHATAPQEGGESDVSVTGGNEPSRQPTSRAEEPIAEEASKGTPTAPTPTVAPNPSSTCPTEGATSCTVASPRPTPTHGEPKERQIDPDIAPEKIGSAASQRISLKRAMMKISAINRFKRMNFGRKNGGKSETASKPDSEETKEKSAPSSSASAEPTPSSPVLSPKAPEKTVESTGSPPLPAIKEDEPRASSKVDDEAPPAPAPTQAAKVSSVPDESSSTRAPELLPQTQQTPTTPTSGDDERRASQASIAASVRSRSESDLFDYQTYLLRPSFSPQDPIGGLIKQARAKDVCGLGRISALENVVKFLRMQKQEQEFEWKQRQKQYREHQQMLKKDLTAWELAAHGDNFTTVRVDQT